MSAQAVPPETTAPVRFGEVAVGGGFRVGHATLDAPGRLNALSADMVALLRPQLQQWEADDGICAVWLDAAGDKAFCAGGDLRQLHGAMRDAAGGRCPPAERFFGEEYALDLLIHTYRKPLLVWAHGIVMGGGVGLLAGASHRVVTEHTRLAMPEIGIGLFPDVGGTWFLPRVRGHAGLFMALTAAPLDAGDVLHAGLADVCIPHLRQLQVWADVQSAGWTGQADADRALLTQVLVRASAAAPASRLQAVAAVIDALVAGPSLAHIAAQLARARASSDPWLRIAADAFARGSPTSAAITLALFERHRHSPLGQVFVGEFHAALGCCAHGDFEEGIRALLVDKDRSPQWQPASVDEVTLDRIEALLQPRYPVPPALQQAAARADGGAS